ncbi:hypothetical protein LCGC14_0569400 [marine sediment metagenome]|uniref:DNA polymerase III beta sliding clamp central domain-containing protein n=1 Tax=marine sediment metagenome TaxID=412755 RepID=A0A0F9U5Y5_9ZZZZ
MAKRTRGTTAPPVQDGHGGLKINRSVFLDALTKVKPGLANKEIVEQSIHFILDNDRIWTYNDQLAISHAIKTGITGAVKASEFHALISKIDGDDIWFEQQEGQILIEAEQDSATVNVDPDIKSQGITVPGINSRQWKPLPGNFVDAVRACLFSVSKSLDRPALNCLWVDQDMIISTDRYRASQHVLDAQIEQPFMLPFIAAKEIGNYNPYKVCVEDRWIHFVNKEKTFFSCRVTDGEYPVETAMAIFDAKGKKLTLPDNLDAAIDFADSILVEDFAIDKFVTLTIEPGLITCSGLSSIGQANRRIKGENGYKGARIQVDVNPAFLKEIIGRLDTVVIADRLLFEGEGFKHVLCLVDDE